jgi:hypothetical protein
MPFSCTQREGHMLGAAPRHIAWPKRAGGLMGLL